MSLLRGAIAATLALTAFAAATARAQERPQVLAPKILPSREPAEAPAADADPDAEKTPAEQVNAVLKTIGKCRQPNQLLEPRCALVIYHQASVILREANVESKDEPLLWWAIYEGIGTSMAQLGMFDKALMSFQAAGGIYDAPREAREESAYFLGRVQHELGRIDQAVHTFDVLFIQNSYWVHQAERDPLLASLRRTEQWQNMIKHHLDADADAPASATPPE